MIPTIGHAAVLVGLALTTFGVVACILAGRSGDGRALASGRRAIIGSFVAAIVACAMMVISLLAHDFSVVYVVENNATTTPAFISAISLWAALEGSILFWTLLATGWASLVMWRHRDRHRQLMPWVGATLASVNLFFFAVMTWPGNPFLRTTPVAAEGLGPNALLQNHPFMALHPPLLYLGYTGMAVPFAFGVAALITKRLDDRVAADRAALDAGPVDLPHARHHRRRVVELRGPRLGRLLGVGPGRERGAAAVADGDSVHPLVDGRRASRRPPHLERRAGGRHLRAHPCGDLPDALGRGRQRPLLHAVGDRSVVPRRHSPCADRRAGAAGLAPARPGGRRATLRAPSAASPPSC